MVVRQKLHGIKEGPVMFGSSQKHLNAKLKCHSQSICMHLWAFLPLFGACSSVFVLDLGLMNQHFAF